MTDQPRSEADEFQVLTDRIQKMEMARALADTGQFEKALEILHKVRAAYIEADKRRMVEWLINDIERRAKGKTPKSNPKKPH